MALKTLTYSEAICDGFDYLLTHYNDTFVIGQGLWSPWYVGNTMKDLEAKFGIDRVIDTPVAENACTGVAVGAAIAGMRPVVVHPRMDFMLYATDPIINEASKWSYMFHGKSKAPVTVRAIINRGGEQGAQHSQSLHSWFAHVPGLRVVMPASVEDARDLLIASVLSEDPVLYIDDRWLYGETATLPAPKEVLLNDIGPKVLEEGEDVTIVAAGFSVKLATQLSKKLAEKGISATVIDLRVINPLDGQTITESVSKTGRLVAIDGGWKNCGLSAEVIAIASETVSIGCWKNKPLRITLPDAPAPAAKSLEESYYPKLDNMLKLITGTFFTD